MKTLRACLHRIAFLLLALAGSGPAGASTLYVSGWAAGESVTIAGRGNVETREFGGTLAGFRGFGYSVDLAQPIDVGDTTGWTVLAPDSDALISAAWLIDTYHPEIESLVQDGVSRATAIAALQVAVWEAISEAPGDYSLSSGEFALESASDGVTALANGFLGALAAAHLLGFAPSSVWAYHDELQDELFTGYSGEFAHAVAEPGAVAMSAAGLLTLGVQHPAVRRRLGR